MKSIVLLLLVFGVMMVTTGYHQKMQNIDRKRPKKSNDKRLRISMGLLPGISPYLSPMGIFVKLILIIVKK
jgi:uncharacterized membrane protein HdeD (DUF308 family)